MKIKKHIKEFSKRATSYDEYTNIQKKVAKKVIEDTKKRGVEYKKILDLGCGTGSVYKSIDWKIETFVGVDASEQMCKLHPNTKKTVVFNRDFDDRYLYEDLKKYSPFDITFSSSALQWSKNFDNILIYIKELSRDISFAIFTDGTFETIYRVSQQKSFLPDAQELVDKISSYWNIEYEIQKYRLYFEDNISKFRYIKRSGVSGGEAGLSYRQVKNLIENYPLDYLEFEVLFLSSV